MADKNRPRRNEEEVIQRIETGLGDMTSAKRQIISLFVDSIDSQNISSALLKSLVNRRKMRGLIAYSRSPCSHMRRVLDRKGVNTNDIFFIDQVTDISGARSVESANAPSNALFLNNSFDADIFLKSIASASSDKDFVFVDISTLQLYHETERIKDFITSMISSPLLPKSCSAVFMASEDTHLELLGTLEALCDKVLNLRGEGDAPA